MVIMYGQCTRKGFIRKLRGKWLIHSQNNIVQDPRKFRLKPPVLTHITWNCDMSYCEEAQNLLKYLCEEAKQCNSQRKKLSTTAQKLRGNVRIKWKKEIKIRYLDWKLTFYKGHGNTLRRHVGEMFQCYELPKQNSLELVGKTK